MILEHTFLNHGKGLTIGAVLASAMMFQAFDAAAASEVKYSYSDLNDDIVYIGTKKAEIYDVAILLNDPALKGARIVGIEVPPGSTTKLSDFSAWLTTELTLEANPETGKKENVPNICSVKANNTNGKITATFDQPYTIGDAPVFVGYTFTVTEVESKNDDDPAKYPVAVVEGTQAGSLFMHTSRFYLKWGDRSEEYKCASALKVIIEGDFPAVSSSLSGVRDVNCQFDEPTISIPLNFASYGSEPISTLKFEYSFQGKNKTAEYKMGEPLTPLFGHSNLIALSIPNEFATGTDNMNITLTEINGKPNTNSDNKATVRVSLLTLFPKKRPLVEEYTGLWCGWCPRGYVAMETMDKRHSDFVGVAIHESDPMAIMEIEDFPSAIGGFPASVIDRYSFQSPQLDLMSANWEKCGTEYTPVKIDAEIRRDDSNPRDIVVTARYSLVEPPKNEYRLTYMLLASNLSDEDWKQKNYFNTSSEKYMDWFHQQGSSVTGLVYNDVLAMHTPWAGEANSVPTDLETYKEYTTEYTFHTDGVRTLEDVDIIGMAGDYLSAIVMMIDTKTGNVLNSAKSYIARAGVEGVAADIEVRPVETVYYDLTGRRIIEPAGGICIRRTVFSDGSAKCEKVVM